MMRDIADARVFVTGGAGFIGSSIVDDLLGRGAQVTVYDNLSSGHLGNLQPVMDRISFIQGDILDSETLSKVMQGHDFVSHQAAQLEILKCLDDPAQDLATNTIGTLNVVRAAIENKVSKVVAASSACVYGQAQRLPQDETHPTNPNWAYGISKLAAEKYGILLGNNDDLPVVMLRYAIIYGPREWYGRVLTLFLKRSLEGKPLIVFGDGKQVRDFTYVSDVVEMNFRCMVDDKADGQAYNVSTGIGTSVTNLAEMIAAQSGVEIVYEDVKEGEVSAHMADRVRLPAELKAMALDNGKARRELGWAPKMSLADGIQHELAWLKGNRDRWHTVAI
jgi:UDP-glucose 4-epimerase